MSFCYDDEEIMDITLGEEGTTIYEKDEQMNEETEVQPFIRSNFEFSHIQRVDSFKKSQSKCRMILCRSSQQKKGFQKFLEKYVLTKALPNPFFLDILVTHELAKKIKRYVKTIVYATCSNESVPKGDKNALYIHELNQKVTLALVKVGSLPSNILKEVQKYHRKYVTDVNIKAESQDLKNDIACEAIDCLSHHMIHNIYLSNLNEDDCKVYYFCGVHLRFFELLFTFLQMEWNIFENCKHWRNELILKYKNDMKIVLNNFPSDVIENLYLFYLNRYAILWIHGDYDVWFSKGLDIFSTASL